MSKDKINWKARCLAAEKCAEMLSIESEGFQKELIDRPSFRVEVEKEVYPRWVMPFWALLFVWSFYLWGSSRYIMGKLQTPILQPYAVSTIGLEVGAYDRQQKILNACQDSWHDDEAIIKRLKRRHD